MKFYIVSVICFVISIYFASQTTVKVAVTTGSGWAMGDGQNTTAAGASCGFAIAGGLGLVAAAIDKKNKA